MSQSGVPEGMVKLAHALVETPNLRFWFYGLEDLPKDLRDAAFSEMAARMRESGDDAELAEAIASLSNSRAYKGVVKAVRERVHEREISQSSGRRYFLTYLLGFLVLVLSVALWLGSRPDEKRGLSSRNELHCPWCADGTHYFTEGPYFNAELNRLTDSLLSCSLKRGFSGLSPAPESNTPARRGGAH